MAQDIAIRDDGFAVSEQGGKQQIEQQVDDEDSSNPPRAAESTRTRTRMMRRPMMKLVFRSASQHAGAHHD